MKQYVKKYLVNQFGNINGEKIYEDALLHKRWRIKWNTEYLLSAWKQ